MTAGAGVRRSASSLAEAAGEIDDLSIEHGRGDDLPGDLNRGAGLAGDPDRARAVGETANLLTVARAVVASASARTESRGAHTREDYPETSPALRLRFVHSGGRSGAPA
jgi:L-aspartate oxidase